MEVSPKRYSVSQVEQAEAEERALDLDTLSDIELLALREQWPLAHSHLHTVRPLLYMRRACDE